MRNQRFFLSLVFVSLLGVAGFQELSTESFVPQAHGQSCYITNHAQFQDALSKGWIAIQKFPNASFNIWAKNCAIAPIRFNVNKVLYPAGHPLRLMVQELYYYKEYPAMTVGELRHFGEYGAGDPGCTYQIDAHLPGEPLSESTIIVGDIVERSTCVDNAQCVDISSPPGPLAPGQSWQMQVQVKNTGNTIWRGSLLYPYRLMSTNPHDKSNFGINRMNLREIVVPGQSTVFVQTVTAPTTPGNYSIDWEMGQELIHRFGTACHETWLVQAPPSSSSSSIASSPASSSIASSIASSIPSSIPSSSSKSSKMSSSLSSCSSVSSMQSSSRHSSSTSSSVMSSSLSSSVYSSIPSSTSSSSLSSLSSLSSSLSSSIASSENSSSSSSLSSSSVSSSLASSSSSNSSLPSGCIDVVKEASDAAGNIISVVPQFLFQLDGSSTAYNDSNGRVRFNNVSIGSHTVSEILTSNWTQQSVTPSGGIVQVQSGDSCAQITFRNRQTTLLPPPPSCGVDIEKSADRYEVQPGDIVSYTVTVRNTSQAVIRDLEVSDDLPSLVTVIDAGGGDQNGNELKRDTSEVEAGGLRTWTYRVRISSDARHGDIITNTAILESSCGTDRASATVRVLEELPQTGFGDFMKGSPYLTKIKASTSAAASGGSAIFLWLAGAMGAAATFVGGIKRFF